MNRSKSTSSSPCAAKHLRSPPTYFSTSALSASVSSSELALCATGITSACDETNGPLGSATYDSSPTEARRCASNFSEDMQNQQSVLTHERSILGKLALALAARAAAARAAAASARRRRVGQRGVRVRAVRRVGWHGGQLDRVHRRHGTQRESVEPPGRARKGV